MFILHTSLFFQNWNTYKILQNIDLKEWRVNRKNKHADYHQAVQKHVNHDGPSTNPLNLLLTTVLMSLELHPPMIVQSFVLYIFFLILIPRWTLQSWGGRKLSCVLYIEGKQIEKQSLVISFIVYIYFHILHTKEEGFIMWKWTNYSFKSNFFPIKHHFKG